MQPTLKPVTLKDHQQWIDRARSILAIGDARKAGDRSDEIVSLLESMERILETADVAKGAYGELGTKDRFEEFKKNYDALRQQYANLAKTAKDDDSVKNIAGDLRLLKQKARLEIGKVKPTANPKVKKQVLASARYEPVYIERMNELRAAQNKLRSMPGVKEQHDRLAEFISKVQKLEPDYKQALLRIGPFMDLDIDDGTLPGIIVQPGVGLNRFVGDAEQISNKLPEKLFPGTSFAEDYQSAQSKLNEYAELAQISDPSGVKRMCARLEQVLKNADSNKTDPAPVNILVTLHTLVSDLDKVLAQLRADENTIANPKKQVAAKWKNLQDHAPESRFAVLKIQRENAESLESCKLFKEAAAAYQALLLAVDKAITDSSAAPAKWNNLQGEIGTMEQKLQQAKPRKELTAIAASLESIIRKARDDAGTHKDYAAACQAIEGIRGDIDAIEQASQGLSLRGTQKDVNATPTVMFPDPNRTLEVKLNAMRERVEQLVAGVKSNEIAELQSKAGQAEPFLAQCADILNGLPALIANVKKSFKTDYSKAKSDSKKQQCLAKALQDIDKKALASQVKLVDDIAQKVSAISGDPQELAKSQRSAAAAGILKACTETISEAEQQLAKLAEFHLPDDHDGSKLLVLKRKELQDLKQQIAGKGNTLSLMRAIAAAAVRDALTEQIAKVEKEIEERGKNAQKLSAELNSKIDKLAASNKDHKDFFSGLRIEVATAAAKMFSKVASVAAKGEAELGDLTSRIDGLQIALKDDTKNFKAVENKVKEIETALEVLKAQDPRAHARLSHEFENVVRPHALKSAPDKALAELDTFKAGALKAAQDRADTLIQNLAAFKKNATDLKKDLEKSGLEKKAPYLYAQLKARRERAKDAARNSLDFAKLELEEIRELMQTAVSKPDVASKLNSNAEEEEFEVERRKREYEAARHMFQIDYMVKAETTAGSARPDEYKQMMHFVKQADRATSAKPPDYAAARESLQRAIDMAKFMIDNPTTDVSPQGRNLEKLNQQWKTRVSSYLNQVSTLINTLDSAEPPTGRGPIDSAAIHKALDPLRSLLNPTVFDNFVAELSRPAKRADLDSRRKTKEETLLRVRKLQKTFDTNLVLKHAAGNTISKVDLKPLRDTLSGMEAQILGS